MNVTKYVGVDWASKGWVAAELDDRGELDVGFYPTIWNLWYDYEDDDLAQILVDIPIGLPEEKRRTCDREAQTELGSQAGSVFLTPIREAVYEDNIEAAKDGHKEVNAGYSIQNQVWGIVPRIREVDTFLLETEEAQEKVRESHPEICFQKFTNETLPKKSTRDGVVKRKDALLKTSRLTESTVDVELNRLTKPEYFPCAAEDDVLDAIVLSITAKRVADDEAKSLPKDRGFDDPPRDDEGLRKEIVYPSPVPRNP